MQVTKENKHVKILLLFSLTSYYCVYMGAYMEHLVKTVISIRVM